MIESGDTVFLIDDNSVAAAVLKYHLSESKKRFPLKIILRRNLRGLRGKIVVPLTAEDIAAKFIGSFLEGKIEKFPPAKREKGKIILCPLYDVSIDDLEIYAKIKKLSYKKIKKDEIYSFLETVKKRKPGVIFSLMNFLKNLK